MAHVILPSGQPRANASRRERISFGAIVRRLVFADGARGRDLDLVDADDGDVGEKRPRKGD